MTTATEYYDYDYYYYYLLWSKAIVNEYEWIMSFIKENEGKVRCRALKSLIHRVRKILVEVVVTPFSKSGKGLLYTGRRSRSIIQGPLRYAKKKKQSH
jgi:hypothetical protein